MKNLYTGEKNVIINMRMAQGGEDKIEWPKYDKANVLTREQIVELQNFADEHGIRLFRFEKFDGDISLIREVIEDLGELQSRYPEVVHKQHRVTLTVSYGLGSNDFAMTRNRLIILNGNAYRSRKRLMEEYQKAANDGWFVKGTDYKAIAHHEFGHVLANVLEVDPLEVACAITGEDSFSTITYVVEQLSRYAGYDPIYGKEIRPFAVSYG